MICFFRNLDTGKTMEHNEFVKYVLSEAKRQYEANTGNLWDDLTEDEKIVFYCEEYERMLMEEFWDMVEQ